MNKIIKLKESDLIGLVKQAVNEQNRKLMNYREIKIINGEGQSELFDVSSVQSSRSGCTFSGRFRGEYNKLYDFFLSDSRYYQERGGENYNDGLFYFEFKCDRSGDEFMLYHSGTKSSIQPKLKYKLSPDAEKTLSGICKCEKYGAPVDVSGSTAVEKNPHEVATKMSPLPIEIIDVERNETRMLNITTVGRHATGCRFYGDERDSPVKSNYQFALVCGKFDTPVDLYYLSNDMGIHKLTPESQKALSDVCGCKPGETINENILNTMKNTKLNESDIKNLIKKVIKEDERRIGYGTEEIRNLEKGLAPDEDIKLTDYTGTLTGEVVKKKDYVIHMLKNIIHDQEWDRIGDVILYMRNRM